MTAVYYTSRQSKLLKEFDRAAGRVRSAFVRRYGEELTDAMIGDARQEYAALIPQLPYVGGKQPFTQFIIAVAWFLALYRVLRRRGETRVAVSEPLQQFIASRSKES